MIFLKSETFTVPLPVESKASNADIIVAAGSSVINVFS